MRGVRPPHPREIGQSRSNGFFLLEAAETANQQTVQKLTPRTINNATTMKQHERRNPQMLSKITFFQDVILDGQRVAKTRQTVVALLWFQDNISNQNALKMCPKSYHKDDAGKSWKMMLKGSQKGARNHIYFQCVCGRLTLGNCWSYLRNT